MKLVLVSTLISFSTLVTVRAYLPSSRPGWGLSSDTTITTNPRTTIPAGELAKILRSQAFDTSTSEYGVVSKDPSIRIESVESEVSLDDLTRLELTDLPVDDGEEESSSLFSEGGGLAMISSSAPKSLIRPGDFLVSIQGGKGASCLECTSGLNQDFTARAIARCVERAAKLGLSTFTVELNRVVS